jgi:hypothetical protein
VVAARIGARGWRQFVEMETRRRARPCYFRMGVRDISKKSREIGRDSQSRGEGNDDG